VGDILTDAFNLYGKYWSVLVPIVAVVAIPLSLIQYAITRYSFTRRVILHPNGTITISSGFWRAVGSGFLIWVIGVLITMIVVGAITRATAGIFVGQRATLEGAYQFGLARLWSILLVSFLVAIIVGVGFILLIIPGLIALTRLISAIPALVVEDRRGTTALVRSNDLVRGYSWPVFGTYLVAAIIAGLVTSLFTAWFSNWFVRGLLAGIAHTITQPFIALVVVLIYLDLRVRKESLDTTTLDRDLQTSAP